MKSAERKVAPVSEYYICSPSKTAQEAFFYPLQCGDFTYEPGYRLQRRSFDSFLLMYIQKGTLLLDYAGGGSIADPWYFGNFDRTYADIVRGCRGLLRQYGYDNHD